MKKATLGSTILGSLVLGCLGCTSVSTEEFQALQRINSAMAQARKDYQLQPGDTVRVAVYQGAELPPDYQQQITLQPDGKITLVNVPTAIEAAGKTVAELTEAIRVAYTPVLKSETGGPNKFEITVQFLTSQKAVWLPDQVFVLGEVSKSAAVPYRKGLTLMAALAQAGGMRYTASESRVVILRTDADGQTVRREVDTEQVVDYTQTDPELQPGDVVFVPMSVIAEMNVFVDFYIRGLLPISPSYISQLLLFGL